MDPHPPLIGRRRAVLLVAFLAAACTTTAGESGARPAASRPAASAPGDPVLDATTIVCRHAVDGSAPPGDWTVVLGAVALPAAPTATALLAVDFGESAAPRLFAKTALTVRAGRAAELTIPDVAANRVGIGWAGAPSVPSRRVVVPACADTSGTGWLTFVGGYWADAPVCLPVTVRSGPAEQQVPVGVGTTCPGQSPAPFP